MSKIVEDAIRSAAGGFGEIPADFRNLKVKDSMPNGNDWGEYNKRLCNAMKQRGCPILEGELDRFWEEDLSFSELVEYIDGVCGYQG
jgi:hypothetical protein